MTQNKKEKIITKNEKPVAVAAVVVVVLSTDCAIISSLATERSSSSYPFIFQVDIRNLNYSELQ